MKNKNIKMISTLVFATLLQNSIAHAATGGAILGGIAGGILGNQVGGGNGKTVATVAGAIGGAIIGDKLSDPAPAPHQAPVQQPVQVQREVVYVERQAPPPPPAQYVVVERSFKDLAVGDEVVIIDRNVEAKIIGERADGTFAVKLLKGGKIVSNLFRSQLAAEHGVSSNSQFSVGQYVVETNSNREAHILAIYSLGYQSERFVLQYMDNGQIQSGWDAYYLAR